MACKAPSGQPGGPCIKCAEQQSRSRIRSRSREDAEAREAAEPQAEECTGKGEECTCAWAHVGVHTSMCESEVEGKGKDMQLWLFPKAQLELLFRDLSCKDHGEIGTNLVRRKINGSRGSSTKA